jgi:hypothetical protein
MQLSAVATNTRGRSPLAAPLHRTPPPKTAHCHFTQRSLGLQKDVSGVRRRHRRLQKTTKISAVSPDRAHVLYGISEEEQESQGATEQVGGHAPKPWLTLCWARTCFLQLLAPQCKCARSCSLSLLCWTGLVNGANSEQHRRATPCMRAIQHSCNITTCRATCPQLSCDITCHVALVPVVEADSKIQDSHSQQQAGSQAGRLEAWGSVDSQASDTTCDAGVARAQQQCEVQQTQQAQQQAQRHEEGPPQWPWQHEHEAKAPQHQFASPAAASVRQPQQQQHQHQFATAAAHAVCVTPWRTPARAKMDGGGFRAAAAAASCGGSAEPWSSLRAPPSSLLTFTPSLAVRGPLMRLLSLRYGDWVRPLSSQRWGPLS